MIPTDAELDALPGSALLALHNELAARCGKVATKRFPTRTDGVRRTAAMARQLRALDWTVTSTDAMLENDPLSTIHAGDAPRVEPKHRARRVEKAAVNGALHPRIAKVVGRGDKGLSTGNTLSAAIRAAILAAKQTDDVILADVRTRFANVPGNAVRHYRKVLVARGLI